MTRARIATFNVHHCEGLDGRLDLDRVADVIKRTEADLVALQELDRGMSRSGGVDQPAELARLTGLSVRFFPTLERGGGEYGIGVAGDSVDFGFELLPRLGDEEPRGFAIGRWAGMTVIASHLSLRRQPRDAQTRALFDVVGRLEGPVVLAGDLNQSGWTLRRAARGLVAVPWWPRRTMARRWAQRDHIVGGRGAVVGRRTVYPTKGSDHFALAADVETP